MPNGQQAGMAVGPHAVFGLDTTGRCTHSTGPALMHIGLRPGQLVGTNLFDLYRGDAINVAALRRVLAGETFSLEREFQGRLLSTYFEPVRDTDGAVTGGLGVTTDITEQRRTEAQLRSARERAGVLADVSAALGRAILDPEVLLRTAVRSLTDSLADVGIAWVLGPDGYQLVPGAVWRSKASPPPTYDEGLLDEGRGLDLSTAESLTGPTRVDTGGSDGDSSRPGEGTRLRVPLRSSGRLLAVIEIARGPERGELDDDEIGLVAEIAERCALALDHALLLEAHREAREELVKFQALAEASDNLIAITDTDDHTVYANPRVQVSGLRLTGHLWKTAAGAEVAEAAQQQIRHALEETGRWSGDVTATTSAGPLTVNIAAFRLHHPDSGAPLGTAWIGQDVTELRLTEAALRQANADLMRFKALVDASPDFIAIADMDGLVQYVNPGGRALVGLAPDAEVAGTTIADYATVEGLSGVEERVLPEALARGHWEGESTLRNHRGGPPIRVVTSTFVVRDVETHLPFAIATVQRDISERLAAERALRELAEQREALLTRLVDAEDAERSRIAADVHDDPVQVCAALDLRLGLLRRQVREQAPALLGTLDTLQDSLTGATDRLRALLFDLEPPDLEHGLTGALTRAAEEILEQTGIRWTVAGDEEPDVAESTKGIAYRIAKEAIINARKHSRATTVAIGVGGREGGLEVSVVDDGIGLGPEPADSSPGHRGVSTMQDRATLAGGRCSIRGRDGGGTAVTVWLPGQAGR